MNKHYEKIILHCGIHKTGSSYLQSLFISNVDVLDRHGIEYPDFRNPNAQHFGNHSIVAVQYRGEKDVLKYLERLLTLKYSQPALLISGEEFSRPQTLATFLTQLISQAPNTRIEVIFYLRRYDHLLESVYSESVKRTLVGGVERAAYELNFPKIVNTAVEIIGAENVIVRPYNRALWARQVLGADFLRTIGIGDAFDEIVEGSNAELNVSLSRIHTFILSCISLKENKQKMLTFFQRKPLAANDTSRYFMSPQRRDILNKSHLIESQKYFEKFGIDDFADFLGIKGTVEEPNWTPFAADVGLIRSYAQSFVDDGNLLDLEKFMEQVENAAIRSPTD